MNCFKLIPRFVLAFAVASAAAQSPTGSITGSVTDPAGALVPGAEITIRNDATGVARTVKSDTAGAYSVPALPPGQYTVAIAGPGFKKEVRSNITLQVQQVARLDFALQLGNTETTVDVTSSAPLLSSEDPTVGQVIENKRIVELPLNGRNFLQLASLSPGVTNTSSPSTGASSFQGGARGAISITVDGQRNAFNHYTLDGIENTDPNFNTYVFLPSVDALQEFKIQTATYPAEYGFAISQINVTTKSGTNAIHGSAFEFLRNSYFDAKNYFDSPTAKIPAFRRNQYGGTIGGPVLKNKLFYLGNFEGLRDSKQQTIVSTVPIATLRGGNFAGRNIIYDPATRVTVGGITTATPFAGNQIPSNRFSPQAVALLNYWAQPNRTGTVSNFVNNEALTNFSDQYMVRVDYQMTSKLSWFGRYSWDKDSQYVPGNLPQQGSALSVRPDQVLAGGTQLINDRMVNEVRFGWTRFVNILGGYNSYKTDVNGTVLHIPGLNITNSPAFWGIPIVSVSGYTGWGEPNAVYLTRSNIWDGHDTFSWTKGKHLLKFGGVFEPIHYNQAGNQFARGSFAEDGSVTGNPAVSGSIGDPLADFLLGYPQFVQSGLTPAQAELHGTYYAGFFEDTWHATPSLTFDLGLRYEYLNPMADQLDNSSNLTDTNTSSPTLVRASNMGTNLGVYDGITPRLTNVPIVRDGRLGAGLVAPDRNNFAPRIGVSYSPTQNTVVRLGYGAFYDLLDSANTIYDMSRTLAGSIQVSTNPSIPNLSFGNPFGGALSGSGTTVNISTPTLLTNDYHMRATYLNEWSANVQQSLGHETVLEIGYVGSSGHRLRRESGINIPQIGTGSSQSRRPWQNIGFVQQAQNVGNSNYNGMQVKLQRSFHSGFTILSAYTWAKSIDNTSGVRPGTGDVLFPNNPFNIDHGEKGLSGFDVRNRWVTSGLIESPVGSGKHFNLGTVGNVLLSGWQLGGIFTIQSGSHFTVTTGFDVNNLGNGYTPRPLLTGQPINLANRSITHWFNTAAFAQQPANQFGNAPRNIVTGPGVVGLDASLVRTVPIHERLGLQLRWEVFNVANHPIFGLPNGTLNSASFGRISSTLIDNREMQIAARFVF